MFPYLAATRITSWPSASQPVPVSNTHMAASSLMVIKLTPIALLNYLALIPTLHPSISRMLYSSSTIFSVQLLQSSEAQTWVDAICEKSGIPLDAPDTVDQLREIDVDTLVQSSHFACSSFRPILDSVTIPSDPRTVVHGDDRWDPCLRKIIFGHCENEVSLNQPRHCTRI